MSVFFRLIMVGVCVVVVLLAGSVGLAATVTFDGSTSTDWNVGSNWDGEVVPGLNDYVIIPSGKTCEIKSADAEANNISVAGTLDIEAGYTLTMDNSGDPAPDSEIDGTLNLEGEDSTLDFSGVDHVISGDGKIVGKNDAAFIDVSGGVEFTSQVTIEGNLRIGNVVAQSNGDFINEGTVNANGNDDGVLWINTAQIKDISTAIWRTSPDIVPGIVNDGPTLRLQDTTTNDAESELAGSFIIVEGTALDVDAGVCTTGTLTWENGVSKGDAKIRFSASNCP